MVAPVPMHRPQSAQSVLTIAQSQVTPQAIRWSPAGRTGNSESAPTWSKPAHTGNGHFRLSQADFERQIFGLAKRIADPNLAAADRQETESKAMKLISGQGYVSDSWRSQYSSMGILSRYVEHVAGFRPVMYLHGAQPVNDGLEVSVGGYRSSDLPAGTDYRIIKRDSDGSVHVVDLLDSRFRMYSRGGSVYVSDRAAIPNGQDRVHLEIPSTGPVVANTGTGRVILRSLFPR